VLLDDLANPPHGSSLSKLMEMAEDCAKRLVGGDGVVTWTGFGGVERRPLRKGEKRTARASDDRSSGRYVVVEREV
jgi:hypothetical protein